MTEAEVLAEIQKIAEAQLDFKGELNPGDDLIADLELDSLALVTLAAALEDRFKITLPDGESARPRTIADLCQLILGRVGEAL